MSTYRITTEKTWDETLADLDETFRKWKVTSWRTDPQRPPRKKYQTEPERTVTLRYTQVGGEVVLVSRKQARAEDNLRALYLAVERMRMIDVADLTDIVRQAYAQLPPPKAEDQAQPAGSSDPYVVLGVQRGDPLDLIEAIYRARMRTAHPDLGGNTPQALQLNSAIEAIRKEKGL